MAGQKASHDTDASESSTLASLTLDPRNARTLELISTSLQELGAARSIVVDEDAVILAGNATVTSAQQASIDRVRVIDEDGTELVAVRRSILTPEQKRRLALLENRAAELASWDAEVLASLAEVIDLSGLWEPDELDALLAAESAPAHLLGDPDEVPEIPEDPVTQPGDFWLLGPHRLLCGDATKPDAIARVMSGERVACLWTDPSYGVSYVGKTADALTLANDDATWFEGRVCAAFTAVQAILTCQ